MRSWHTTILGISLLAAGCSTAGPQLRNPQPEVLAVPPQDDDRYSRPIEYPKELLNRPPVKPTTPGGKPGMRAGGAGMGPGGPGM